MSHLKLPPLSLYVHIPWCVKKCPYCDFNSHERNSHNDNISFYDYTRKVIEDLTQEARFSYGRPLESIFFGGGTPSLMPAEYIATIIQTARTLFTFSKTIEITLEANPGTIEYGNFNDFATAGINRISLGAQSFNTTHLNKLGRIHSQNDIYQAYEQARDAGLNNINIDLMHGLPGQTFEDAKNDLALAVSLQPEHISWYQLTIEQNTAFYSSPPLLPHEDILASISDYGLAFLQKQAYLQYEVSAYAREKKYSIHNLNYWNFGDYIGVGAGAHGKITHVENNIVTRSHKTRVPKDYIDTYNKAAAKHKTIDASSLAFEFMMNALRINKPLSIELFQDRTGLKIDIIKKQIDNLVTKKLLEINDTYIQKTPLGQRYLDNILTEFLP